MAEKTVVVTGASGLVGRALIPYLAKKGYRLLLCARSKRGVLDLYKDINGLIDVIELKLEDQLNSFEIFEDKISDRDIRGFIHLAVTRPGQESLENGKVTFEESVRKNATSMMLLWDIFARKIASNGGGSMIFMSSIYGSRAPDFGVYNGTTMGTEPDYPFLKAGGVALSRYYASLYGDRGVRSNAIILGGIENGQPRSFVEKYAERTCLKRMARAEDVVGLCEFLISDSSCYITGTEIPVDGGLLCL